MNFEDPRWLLGAMIVFAAGLLAGARVVQQVKTKTERQLMSALENLTAAIASL